MDKEIREFLMHLIFGIEIIVLCVCFYCLGQIDAKVEMIEQISEQVIEENDVRVKEVEKDE